MSIIKDILLISENIIFDLSEDMMKHLNTVIKDNQMLVENDTYQVLDVLYNCPGLMSYNLQGNSICCEIDSFSPIKRVIQDIKHEILDLIEIREKHIQEDLKLIKDKNYSCKIYIILEQDVLNDFKKEYQDNYPDNKIFYNITNVEDFTILDDRISLTVKKENFPHLEVIKRVINQIEEIYQKRTPQVKI